MINLNKILNSNINNLSLDSDCLSKLNAANINKIYELCILDRKKLKEYKLSVEQINNIIIRLQLLGLDINKRYKM